MKTELIEQFDVPTGSSGPTEHQHLFAVAWIAIAWIVGSLVFEVTANGAEVEIASPSIMQQWQQQETDYAIAFAGIDYFERIQRESELRPVFQTVIASAQRRAIAQKSRKPNSGSSQSVSSQPVTSKPVASNPVTTIPVTTIPATIALPRDDIKVDSAGDPVAKPTVIANDAIPQLVQQVVHSFQEWMSPVHVDVPALASSAPAQTEDAIAIDPIPSAPTVSKNTQLESITVADAHIVRAVAKPVVVPQRNTPVNNAAVNNIAVINAPVKPAIVSTQSPDDKIVAAEPAAKSAPADRIVAKWPLDASDLLSGNLLGTAQPQNSGSSVGRVRGVIEMLAPGYGMNILVAPDVQGTVTANVEGLSPEQALDDVIKMCNLNLQREGDLIYVYPDTKLPSDARELRVFTLDFVRAETLKPAVQGLSSPVGSAFTTQLDTSDNMRTQETIVVIDIPEAVMQVENYVFQADRAPRQVMIEANILEVELKDDMVHGVNFGSILGGDLSIGSMNFADPISDAAGNAVTNPLFFAQIDGSEVTSLIDLLETTTDSKHSRRPDCKSSTGKMLQRREAERSRTEIVVALTCHIVEPCAIDEQTENDLQRTNEELFHGLLQRNCRPWDPECPTRPVTTGTWM